MEVRIGVEYTSYGYVTVDVPDDFEDKDDKEILEYLNLPEVARDIPLPDDPYYLDDSFRVDETYIERIG